MEMSDENFSAMEVRPDNNGWYDVTLFQFKKEKPEHPDYIRESLYFGGAWEYCGEYSGTCYVCFIHSKEN